MLRTRLWIVPLLAVAFCPVGLAQAQKQRARAARATLTGDVAPAMRQWLAGVRYQPNATVNVVRYRAGSTEADAHALRMPDGTDQIQWGNTAAQGEPQWTFDHELGHAFDYSNLSDLTRQRFRGIMHDQRAWQATPTDANSPQEQFAEAYALLAMHPWAAQSRRGWNRLLRYEQTPYARKVTEGYKFAPTYYQLRKISNLIRAAA